MKKIILLLLILLNFSCQEEESLTAEEIVDKAIEVAGGERYDRAKIEFVFRKRKFSSSRKDGIFEFSRTVEDDSLGRTEDVLNNEGVRRFVDGREITLADSTASAIGESINSVHYFVQLPYGLQGEAVQKELVGTDTISGEEYYEIKVTFRKEGGGKDHEDIYMYWIQKDDFTVDYLAYRFFINEGGIRFRKAVNPRVVNGIRFVDYENYKTEALDTPLHQLDDIFVEKGLPKVSQIANEILSVELQ